MDHRSITVRIFPRAAQEVPARDSAQELPPYRSGRGGRDPLYVRIADDLRDQITSGALEPGGQLSTEADLGERYAASRNTVRNAVKRLISQGLVETRPGQGTFVARRIDPFVTVLTADSAAGISIGEGTSYLSEVSAQHRRPSATTPRVEVQAPSAAIFSRLRVEASAPVISRHQQRYIDDIPWSVQTSFYPMEFVTRGASRLLMAEEIPEGAVRYLAETLDLKQTGYRDWITTRHPHDNEQVFFNIAHDSIVFELFRTAFDQNSNPMRVTVTVFPADRNQFIVDSGDVPDPPYHEETEDGTAD